MKGAILFFIFFFSTIIAGQTSPHINIYVKENFSLGACDFNINIFIKLVLNSRKSIQEHSEHDFLQM